MHETKTSIVLLVSFLLHCCATKFYSFIAVIAACILCPFEKLVKSRLVHQDLKKCMLFYYGL